MLVASDTLGAWKPAWLDETANGSNPSMAGLNLMIDFIFLFCQFELLHKCRLNSKSQCIEDPGMTKSSGGAPRTKPSWLELSEPSKNPRILRPATIINYPGIDNRTAA